LSPRDRERMAATGFEMIETAEALAVLDRIVDLNLPQAAVIKARWDAVSARFTHGDLPPLLRVVGATRGAQAPAQGSAKVNALKPRLDAAPDSEKQDVIVAFVREQVAKALGLTSPGTLDLRTPFTDLGLDSLMAVELRNGLSAGTGLELRPALVYDHPCIEDLARHLGATLLGDVKGAADAADEGEQSWETMAEGLDDLSEQELAGLLSAGMAPLKLEDQ